MGPLSLESSVLWDWPGIVRLAFNIANAESCITLADGQWADTLIPEGFPSNAAVSNRAV